MPAGVRVDHQGRRSGRLGGERRDGREGQARDREDSVGVGTIDHRRATPCKQRGRLWTAAIDYGNGVLGEVSDTACARVRPALPKGERPGGTTTTWNTKFDRTLEGRPCPVNKPNMAGGTPLMVM